MNYRLISSSCILTFALFGTIPVSLAEKDNQSSAEKNAWDQVLELYEKAKEAGEQVPQDVYEWVKQDFRKIGDWEYLVTDMPISDSNEVQKRLNELGTDRWECIWIHSSGGKTSFIFKRPVRNYLKIIPLSQLMKLVPRGDSNESEE